MLRSTFAVIVGYMVMMLVAVAVAGVAYTRFGVRGQVMSAGYLTYNLVTGAVAALVGGVVTGSIAEARRVRHGYILAMVVMLMTLLPYVHGMSRQPGWYQGVMLVVPAVFVVLGAKLAEIRAVRAGV